MRTCNTLPVKYCADGIFRPPFNYVRRRIRSRKQKGRQEEMEAEEELVINHVYSLFEFNRTLGSIRQFIERTTPPQRTDKSQLGMYTREQNLTGHPMKRHRIAST